MLELGNPIGLRNGPWNAAPLRQLSSRLPSVIVSCGRGGLFAVVIRGDVEPVLAAWRANENDRAQRAMLGAAIEASSPEGWKRTPNASDDLLWVLGRADALSNARNDAIHALVSLHIGAEIVEVRVALPPRGRREKNLLENVARGKKLIDEFAKCAQDADALSIFVRQATEALAKPDQQAWPTRRPKQIW